MEAARPDTFIRRTTNVATRLVRRPAVVLAALFVLGVGVRLHHLDTVPKPNETVDEYAWTWAGMTILEEHTPRSWSYLAAYPPVPRTMWRGHEYYIVRPWLDHPPLFAVLVGGWMLIGGYHDLFVVNLGWMRSLSLLLFACNFLVLIRLARHYFPSEAVLFGLGCFAIAPLAVVNQKLVVSENLFVLVWMLTQLSVLHDSESRRKRWLAAVAVGSIALPLIKIAALSCSLQLAMLAALRRNRRAFITVVSSTALALLLYFAWGYHYSWTIFQAVMAAHARRFVGLGGGWELMFALKMVDHYFVYAPFIFALVAIIIDSQDAQRREFYLQYFVYLIAMTFFVDERSVYGWYTIPLYPVACIAVARGAITMIRGPSSGYLVLIWALMVLPFTPTLLQNQLPLPLLRFVFLGIVLLACTSVVLCQHGRPRLARVMAIGLLAVQLAADLYYDFTV